MEVPCISSLSGLLKMQIQILSVFLGRLLLQSYFLKKLFLGLGMDYVLSLLTLMDVTALMFQSRSGICF